MPRRAAAEATLLQEHNILPARFGQMIRHGTAHDSSTDDHDARFLRQLLRGQFERGLNGGVGYVCAMHD
jgi:hypothetical protein